MIDTTNVGCPFCKNALNPGATVCAGCGAYKWGLPKTLLQICRYVFSGLPALAGLLAIFGGTIFGGLALLAFGAGMYAMIGAVMRSLMKDGWVRRAGA
jgi:hypothetical protein